MLHPLIYLKARNRSSMDKLLNKITDNIGLSNDLRKSSRLFLTRMEYFSLGKFENLDSIFENIDSRVYDGSWR